MKILSEIPVMLKSKQPCGMCLQNLTFGFHTVILKLITLPRKMFVRFRRANWNLKKRFSSFFLHINTGFLWYCASSEHASVPFRRGDTEFAAMSPADPIVLNTILCQEHSGYLRALCVWYQSKFNFKKLENLSVIYTKSSYHVFYLSKAFCKCLS